MFHHLDLHNYGRPSCPGGRWIPRQSSYTQILSSVESLLRQSLYTQVLSPVEILLKGNFLSYFLEDLRSSFPMELRPQPTLLPLKRFYLRPILDIHWTQWQKFVRSMLGSRSCLLPRCFSHSPTGDVPP